MKKLACLLLALTLACSLCPPVQAEGVLEDLDAFRAAFFAHTDAGDGSFTLTYTDAVREALLQSAADETPGAERSLNNSLFGVMMLNAGAIQCRYYESFSQREGVWMLKIQQIRWYAGKKIALAAQKGDLSGLSGREKETLRIAQEFVETLSGTEAEKALAIHDYLCARVTGFEDEDDFNDDDCAVGALLDGLANCDGYADAFYLLCALAGIGAYPVCGTVRNGMHMWNAARIGGEWMMVDVTGDDQASFASRLYFSIGAERMALDHAWTPETLPFIPAEDGTARAESWEAIGEALRAQAASRPERIAVVHSAGLNVRGEPERLAGLIAQAGVSSYSWAFSADAFELYNITYCDVFGYFTDEEEAVAFINGQDAENPPEELFLAFSDELGSRLFANGFWGLRTLLGRTELASPISWEYLGNCYGVIVSSPVYGAPPLVNSEKELRSFLRDAFSEKPAETAFRYGEGLRLSDALLNREVYSLGASDFSYMFDGARVRLRLRYFEEYRVVDTLDEAAAYLRECAAAGISEFRLYCPQTLFIRLATNDCARLREMLEEAGYTGYALSTGVNYRMIVVEDAH